MSLTKVEVLRADGTHPQSPSIPRVSAAGVVLEANHKVVTLSVGWVRGKFRALDDEEQEPIRFLLHPLATKDLADELCRANQQYVKEPPSG